MASISHLRIAPFSSWCNNSRIILPSLSSNNNLKTSSSSSIQCRPIKCTAIGDETSHRTQVVRRSGNYEPSIWNYNYIQSLKSDYLGEACTKRVDHLKENVRMMLGQTVDPLSQLELIDVLQRLGVSYHFELEIEKILGRIYKNFDNKNKKGLHATALEFRLLRQHGHNVPQGVFNGFIDESSGNFKACLCEDIKGILSLYEASYLSVEGENIMEKASDFTTQHLEDYVNNKHKDKNDDRQEVSLSSIRHALEFPLHWRIQRVETRWFIDAYEKRHDKNHVLLELAKLDFNMLQAIHQEDLKDKSRWWNNLGLAEKLTFSRDRLIENFLWTVGLTYEPKFSHSRKMATETYALITTVDDVYDVYGTLDELELFTDAIERWDVNTMKQLPDYMKPCFLAVINSTNKLAFDVLNKQGIYVFHYLKKSWVDLCKSYLMEAKWYYSGYKPSFEEYIDYAWISLGATTVLVHVYFCVANTITKEVLDGLDKYHDLIRYSSLVSRLADDLGTSMDEQKRGDVSKSIQCYMNDKGCSEEDARKHIKHMIKTTWTKVNKVARDCPFPRDYIEVVLNMARMAQHMYHNGDGHGSQNQASKDRILSLLIESITVVIGKANV